MHWLSIIQILTLLAAANGSPVFVHWIWKDRAAYALDGGLRLADNRPLFGPSKTWRGIICAILVTTLAAAAMALPISLGFQVGLAAMLGDLFSSFIKRRIGLRSGDMAFGLDQIPESLFPLPLIYHFLQLNLPDGAVIVAVFMIGELLLAQMLFLLHIRERPY
jgi:hypothetical protein